MDYRKIDAALATALDTVPDPEQRVLTIFIHTTSDPAPDKIQLLKEKGINIDANPGTIFTATVSPRTISELSDQPWVRALKLSQKLRAIEGS